ncbi:hypothetical protein SPW_7366 [Streptomyces sp. W007]|nr:hypothetical protein SPW_7366 [Streptomyces sp. W007]
MGRRKGLTEENDMSMDTHRETVLTVTGITRVIRTERTGTVKKLEADHTRAVKAALVDMRKAGVPDLRARARAVGEGGKGRISKMADLWERGGFTPYGTYNVAAMRKPFPKVTPADVPDYFVETAPGEYVTSEIAEESGATEMLEEILPGLKVGRDGRYWVLRLAGSATAEKPNGTHLGPCFRTKAAARKSALTELASFNWTRPHAEIRDDERAKTVVVWIKLREFAARKPSDQWRQEDARKAEVAIRELEHPASETLAA